VITIRAEIMKLKKRKVRGRKVEFPKKIELIADNKDEEEILQFIMEMSDVKAFMPTMEKIQEMIKDGVLTQNGLEWKFNMHKVMMDTAPEVMYG